MGGGRQRHQDTGISRIRALASTADRPPSLPYSMPAMLPLSQSSPRLPFTDGSSAARILVLPSCGQASTTTTDSARQMDGCGHDESTSVASTSRMRYMASYPSTQHLIHLAHRWRTPFYAVHPSGSQLDLHNFRPSGIRVRPDSIQASLR